jgi:TRAP-type mannitol/chloroaromatic compound transport system substrate-binding protein
MIRRRRFLTAFAAATAAGGLARTGRAQGVSKGRIEWRMVTSWPKGLPGLGTGAERIAKRIGAMSDGRLTVKVYAGGELVPSLQVFDAVAAGTVEMGHGAAYYNLQKSPAAGFFTSVPFGLTAAELNAWVYWGGGQELWDELYGRFGVKPFLGGNTGVQMGGWFRKEIKSLDDVRGLKIRMPGHGGEVLRKLGAAQVLLAGGEIFANLQSGAIDAAEWVGPYNDLSLGFYQVAKFYYWPGFHEPGAALECIVSKAKFEALSPDLKQIVTAACAAENDLMLAEFHARSAPSLQVLVVKHGVQLRQFPREVLIGIGNAAGELMEELRNNADPLVRKITTEFLRVRTLQSAWTRISDQAIANARLLPFNFPKT